MRKSTKFWLITLTILVGVLFYFFTEEMIICVIILYILINGFFCFASFNFEDEDWEFEIWKLFIVIFLICYISYIIEATVILIYKLIIKFNKWLDK